MARAQKDPEQLSTTAKFPDLSELAADGAPFDCRFWEATPALAWVEDEAGHVCRCDANCRLSVPGAAVGADGHDQYLLEVHFPFANGGHRCLGHVALDITRQQEKLDQLLHLAVEDDLTGLYNRRGFQLFAEHELRAARRRVTHSAVIFVDIDGLKDINDRSGHERGDAVLVETARLLRDVFRECDVIARLGGDEFAVFAGDVRGDPELLRSRLRTRLANWHAMPATPAQLRISAGLAYNDAAQSKPLAQLLAEADLAMYADKAGKARSP